MAQRKEYPAWFLRVTATTGIPEPNDFDEDISEIDPNEVPEEYDFDRGPDHQYDRYFTCIAARNQRKEQLARERERKAELQEAKKAQMEMESAKRDIVRPLYEAMAKAEEDGDSLTVDPEVYCAKTYNLYSPEYTEWTFERLMLQGEPPSFLEMRYIDEDLINGVLHLDMYNSSEHEGHELRTSASATEHRIPLGPNLASSDRFLGVNLKPDEKEWSFGLVIIDEDHVLVRASRELVFRPFSVEGMPDGAPEVFEFWGISREQDG